MNSRKLIIRIQDDSVSDMEAIWMVLMVVKGGRVSETAKRRHYCHLSVAKDGTEL